MPKNWTPGPWMAGPYARVVVPAGKGLSQAVVAEVFDGMNNDSINMGKAYVNTNLIAAAPELYEALEMAKWYMTQPNQLKGVTFGEYEKCVKAHAMVDAAMREARGE